LNKELYAKFIKDERFSADTTATKVVFKHNYITSYDVTHIKLGDIRRYANKRLSSIEDTSLYQLCCNPYNKELRQAYEEYCGVDQNSLDNSDRSLKLFLSMINMFRNTDYSINEGAIIVDQYNCIVDGFHRTCILLKEYGPDYNIDVVKVRMKTGKRITVLSTLFEIRIRIKRLFKGRKRKG